MFRYVFLFITSIILQQTKIAAEESGNNEQNRGINLTLLKGHLKPLGSVGPYFKIVETEAFLSSPREFFNKYVIPSTPLLMKNAAKTFPAFTKWTDTYFLNHPGSKLEKVFVEGGKKENRLSKGEMMTFKKYIEIYNTTDKYLVHSLPSYLRSDVIIPPPLQCGPVLDNMIEVLTWFSSGGTKSVLHSDHLENINCLLRGNKSIILINPHNEVEFKLLDNANGAYSSMDVDAVDYIQFPALADIEYARVDMKAGDCIFIPYRWLHQINSHGNNLAINIWWKHKTKEYLDLTDEVCDDITDKKTITDMSFPGTRSLEPEVPEFDKNDRDVLKKEALTALKNMVEEMKTEVLSRDKMKFDSDEEKSPNLGKIKEIVQKHLKSRKSKENSESKKQEETDNPQMPYINDENETIIGTIYNQIVQKGRTVYIDELKKFVIRIFPQLLIREWDDACEDLISGYFKLLDHNKDNKITLADAALYKNADILTQSQYNEQSSIFVNELQRALLRATTQKDKEIVQVLVNRGELDGKQFTAIFGNGLETKSTMGKEEL